MDTLKTVSMFKSAKGTKPSDVKVSDALRDIREGRWKDQIELIRDKYWLIVIFENDRDKAKEAIRPAKEELPAVTPSGRFSYRNHKSLIEHSGLLCADLDELGDRLPEIREKLRLSPHVWALFLSPSGDGIKVVFRVPADSACHDASFRAVRAHVLAVAGVEIDESCKDVARLCFVSYDPHLYHNSKAVELQPLPEEAEKPKAPNVQHSEKPTKEKVREMLRCIPPRPNYPDWLRIASAVADALPDNEAIEVLQEWSEEEKPGEYAAKLRKRLQDVHIWTLIYEARKHGWRGKITAIPFPLECLPPAIEAMARAIAKVERTPESLAGVCTLGILSASIGAGLVVKSGPERVTWGNLFLIASAESGSGKSETFRHAARSLQEFERGLIERWKAGTLPGLQAEKDILESTIANLKRDAGKADGADERDGIKARLEEKKAKLAKVEESLHAPVLIVEDVTTERLAMLLSQRGECLASLSPDAGAIVNNLLGRYSKIDRTDEGIYLKAYSGDYCRIDRIGREPVVLRAPHLAVLWLTQPDKVETLLAERSLTDGGLIPRFLICHTNAEPRPIIEGAAGIPAGVSSEYERIVFTLLETYRLASEPRTIELAPEALAAMNAHYNGIAERRRADLRDVSTYAARWNEQAWRIAVCLHAGTYGDWAHEMPLSLATTQAAIEIADWFAGQQLEILSAGRHAARRKIRDEVLSLLADNPAGIRASDVYRKRITRDAEEAHTLLASMEAEGELTGRDEQPEGGGHVTRIYTKARK